MRINPSPLLLAAALMACTVDSTHNSADSTDVSQNTQAPAATATRDSLHTVSPTPVPAPEPAPAPADAADSAPPPAPATPAPTSKLVVTPDGIGLAKAGMPVAEANAVLGGILAIPARLSECDYVRPKSEPKNLAFMVEKGKISRVEVRAGSNLATAEGAKIGDTEARIKTLYPGVEVRPSKYGTGHTLVVTPKVGANNRIVFETDGKKVVSYRSGAMPAVEYVEGCG